MASKEKNGSPQIPEVFIKRIGEFFIGQNDQGLAILDADKVFFTNKTFSDLTGYEEAELSGTSFLDIIPIDYKKMISSSFTSKDPARPQRKYKLSVISKNGSAFPAEISIHPLVVNDVLYSVVIIADTTERQWTEEILRENEEKYRDLFENSNDIIQSVSVSGHFIYVNRAWKEVLGYSDKDVSSLTVFDIIHPESAEYWKNIFAKLLKGEETEKMIELKMVKNGGDTIVVEGNLGCKFVDNKPVAQRSILRDITQRKEAERSLKEAKEYAERLIQTANVMVVGLDIIGNIIVFNEEAEHLTGYSKKELEGKNWFDMIVPKKNYPEIWRMFNNWKKNGQMPSFSETPIMTKDGRERFISWRNSELPMGGDKAGTISFGMDITDRKMAEESLKQSEERYRRLIEYLPDSILVYSEGKILYANPSGVRLLGAKNQEEIVGRSLSSFLPVHQSEGAGPNSCITKLQIDNTSGTVENCSAESQLIRLDGEAIDVSMRSLPFEFQGRMVSQLVFQDVTAEKRAKQELLERNMELEEMNKLMVGRELKMIELKGRIAELQSRIDAQKNAPGAREKINPQSK